MNMKFYKMCASGNDFIVIDNRENIIVGPKKIAKKICQRRMQIGADGLLLLESSKTHDIKMRIFNADGSEAEMCGNGARCAALFCHTIVGFDKHFVMETLAGPVDATVGRGKVKVKLPDPKDFRDIAPLEVDGGIFYFYFLNTSVPHAVIFEESIDTFPVFSVGRQIRGHDHFQPQGTNVNFVEIIDKHAIAIRTYERGVEDETFACGTGSTASAIVSALIGKCASPVHVTTRGGEVLKIIFNSQTYGVRDVFLEGKAQFVYEGILDTIK